MKTPKILIAELGGPHAVAEKVGRRPGAVRMWVNRDVLPRPAWPELLSAFPQLTMDDLRDVERAGKAA